MSGAIDLSQLPPPVVVEQLDFDTTLDARREAFVSLFPAEIQDTIRRTLNLPSDPGEKLLEFSTYLENLMRQRINEASLSTMLAYAEDTDLDNLAANYNVQRLVITPADNTTTPPTPAVMESDDALRLRVQNTMETLSVAGPTGAYEAFARAADGRVADAKAISPSPACVTVSILSTDGDGTADSALLDTVSAALNDEDVRPVADRLTVQSAEIVTYLIDAVLMMEDGPQTEVIRKAAQQRASDYAISQYRIGRTIYRAKIIGILNSEGVNNIILNSPATDIPVSNTQASWCTSVSVRTSTNVEGVSSE
ncbi:baseplate assembly protein [Enterobacter sp. CGMCC 5087]|uniref:baseplate J/gp47 family protein n=1 Tax=Enterobacter sp. CGMCC 5087 TaxID=2183878 RepID=UPI000D67B098|nr:baseplate J/gp47 family protein [Enterobacter sp. CGMCC 5087]PWI80489.1 baseplate assembly protein [Enterobacter sp. CGMCC 5087]